MPMRECRSCAARSGEAAFPLLRVPAHATLCCDCAADLARVRGPADRLILARKILRAGYRAALRHREASPQGDLVDLIVRAP